MDLLWLAALVAFFASSWIFMRVVAGVKEEE